MSIRKYSNEDIDASSQKQFNNQRFLNRSCEIGSFYAWRSKFGGMDVSDAKRLKALAIENARLKKLLAEAMLENEVTREALRKKW